MKTQGGTNMTVNLGRDKVPASVPRAVNLSPASKRVDTHPWLQLDIISEPSILYTLK